MENIGKDLKLKKIRDRLNEEKVKLWLPPFTTEDKEKGIEPVELIKTYSSGFNLDPVEVAHLLEELRLHALSKLAERDKFNSEGLATLRVRITCPLPSEGSSASRRPFPLECRLSILGSQLKSLIAAAQDDMSPDLLKVICKGKVLKEGSSLEGQGIKHGSDIMAMCMTSSEARLAEKETEMLMVEKTRKAAELLSRKGEDFDDFDVQIADQSGKPISLPVEEKRALTLAMTLHEKGRAALKQKKVSHALLLLLEADSEFSKCSSDLLQCVDNYGILCLDIVWCYLLLKNLDQLPDAERRLTTSESCFKRSYGEKMERLTAIKGGSGTEQALFMRLYLLQGVVAFHRGDLREAQNLFRRAEFVLTLLHVDEDQLNQVMLMGFTEREARLGLRARNGNVQQAVEHIMEKRKELEENNTKARAEWNKRVLGRKLGKTADGQSVNVESYNNLLAMEFPKGAAAEALRQCNNDISTAIEFLQNHPELFSLPDPGKKRIHITDHMMQQVTALGFDEAVARQALQHFQGSIERAVEELISHGGVLPFLSASHGHSSSSHGEGEGSSSSESDCSRSESSSSAASAESSLKRKKEREELDTLVSDINTDTNDHLDLTLVEEREILSTYQGLASSLGTPGSS